MSIKGMISARKVLEQLDDKVWFAAITEVADANGIKDFKINLEQIKQHVYESIDKAALGLDKVDNTSDQDKPISLAVAEALLNKVSNDELSPKVNDILTALGATITDEGDLVLDEGEVEGSVVQ